MENRTLAYVDGMVIQVLAVALYRVTWIASGRSVVCNAGDSAGNGGFCRITFGRGNVIVRRAKNRPIHRIDVRDYAETITTIDSDGTTIHCHLPDNSSMESHIKINSRFWFVVEDSSPMLYDVRRNVLFGNDWSVFDEAFENGSDWTSDGSDYACDSHDGHRGHHGTR